MAELPKDIRRPGGDMVAARSPFGRRVLLPTEAELCNSLGLTEEEYFQFLEGVAAKVKERPEAYGLVPEIVNMPQVLFVAGWGSALTFFGQIVVGVALTYVASLLAPKPPSQKQGTAQKTADIIGAKRFAPQHSFNSIQELANLGDLVPLVFTNRGQNPNGGIRVSSQMMWSQLVSLGRYQQLKILALFSLGQLQEEPEFKGYAIGDLLISNYHSEKLYKVGGTIPFRIGYPIEKIPGDRNVFTDDVFKIDNQEYFCGTRNPTTQSAFGLSSPMPNATYFSLPYELVRWDQRDGDEVRPANRKQAQRRAKNLGLWPMRSGFAGGGTANQRAGTEELPVGTHITYQVVGGPKGDFNAEQQNTYIHHGSANYGGVGVEDVNAVTASVRESTDGHIAEGEQYLAGTALVSCTMGGDNTDYPGQPWEAFRSSTRQYTFKVIEAGKFECVPDSTVGLGTHCNNPRWFDNGSYFRVKNSYFYIGQEKNQIYPPHNRYALQKITIGSVSDNRACHITEIGLKSKVFKQIQGLNVNSKPTEDDIQSYYRDRSSFQLGQVQAYTNRISFFKLQIRKVGDETWSNDNWIQPDRNNHTGLFCVKGNTPEFQYNYIRIEHPEDQYEYRFFPWPGNDVIKDVEASGGTANRYACLLNANSATDPNSIHQFRSGDFVIKFAGVLDFALTKDSLSNKEWNLSNPGGTTTTTRSVQGLGTNHYQNHDFGPDDIASMLKTNDNVFTKFYGPQADSWPTSYTDNTDNHTLITRQNTAGSPIFHLYINPSDVTPNTAGITGPAWGSKQTLQVAEELITLSDGAKTFKGVNGEYGINFHYAIADANGNSTGLGGKYIPILDSTIPGAGANGHPGGDTTLYYVRKIEQYNEPIDPWVDTILDTQNEDDAGNEIAKGDGLSVHMKVYRNPNYTSHIYAVWEIENRGNDNYEVGDKVIIPLVKKPGYNSTLVPAQRVLVNVTEITSQPELQDGGPSELNPYDVAADFWKYQGDKSSHLDGPEHQITYVNEIVKLTGSDRANYHDLAYAGLRVNSSREWTNFTQFSAYFQKGIKVEKPNGLSSATSLFPEIAYALLTDKKIGAGEIIPKDSVDITEPGNSDSNIEISAKFCKANKLFWDGMISNRINLREFIYEHGIYCLLDFTVIGGKFSLFPAVPFNSDDHKINHDALPVIKAMFTDGNVKDLQVNFLAPEDRQTFKANILYRKEKLNGFAETKSIIIRLAGSDHEDDPVETYDLSGFCTSIEHAMTYAKYVLSVREFTDHTVSFKTAPHYVNGVKPGDYIRVFSTTQHVQRFNNGAILDDGTVVSKDTITGSKDFYYWNPSSEEVLEATVDFSDSSAVKAYAGTLFTIKESEAKDQCYKVESITFGDDGLIDLTGSYTKLSSDGKLAILQGWFDNTRFTIDD